MYINKCSIFVQCVFSPSEPGSICAHLTLSALGDPRLSRLDPITSSIIRDQEKREATHMIWLLSENMINP